MHLADGVLNLSTLVACAALSAGGIALGLRRLSAQSLPLAALFAAVFFVVGTVHIPIGVGSVHLVLNGLIGVLLGWLAFPVIFVALSLQALLFSFGGFAVLGANTLLLAAPAVLAHFALRPLLGRSTAAATELHTVTAHRRGLLLAGVLAATLGIGGAVLGAAVMLWSTGQDALLGLIGLIALAQIPVWLIDAAVSALVIATLGRVLPRAFDLTRAQSR